MESIRATYETFNIQIIFNSDGSGNRAVCSVLYGNGMHRRIGFSRLEKSHGTESAENEDAERRLSRTLQFYCNPRK